MPDPLPPKRPTTIAALSDEIARAAPSNVFVRISGSGSFPLTTFSDQTRPIQPISMLRLNKVIEHAVPDMTVIVQAGISLEALQKQLAWHNQWLPVDPPAIALATGTPQASGLQSLGSPGARTLGGLIASNSLGPLRFGCGDWRLLIMGITWVDAGGKILKGGGRTVKNVAGYNTPRLMIGSCGSLGAIAEVTLRTFARPADEQCILFYCPDAVHAEQLLAEIMVAPVAAAYVQVIGGMTFADNPLNLPPSQPGGMVVAIGFLGGPEVCAAQVQVTRALPAAREMESIAQTAAQAGRLRLWMTVEPSAATGGMGFRIIVKSSEVTELIGRLESLARNAGTQAWLVSEAGNGVIRGMIAGENISAAIISLVTETQGRLFWTQGVQASPSREILYTRLKTELDTRSLFGDPPA